MRRSTQASAAVERLKARSGNPLYALARRSDGLFSLRLTSPTGQTEAIGTPLPMDEFVQFVDVLDTQKPKPASKLETAFRSQLNRK